MDKPDGFDFNNRRADKTNSGRDWTPPDALYDASQNLSPSTKALLVIWLDEEGVRFRLSGGAEHGALLAAKYLQHGI